MTNAKYEPIDCDAYMGHQATRCFENIPFSKIVNCGSISNKP